MLNMCDVCRRNPCAPTCPNAEPDLYCAWCAERIRKGRTYLTANDEFYHRIEFCSEECLRKYYDVEEEEA